MQNVYPDDPDKHAGAAVAARGIYTMGHIKDSPAPYSLSARQFVYWVWSPSHATHAICA